MIALTGPGQQFGVSPLTDHSRGVLQRAIDRVTTKSGSIDRLVFDTNEGLWKVRIRMTDKHELEVTWRFVC